MTPEYCFWKDSFYGGMQNIYPPYDEAFLPGHIHRQPTDIHQRLSAPTNIDLDSDWLMQQYEGVGISSLVASSKENSIMSCGIAL
jgi:hypothetical protein